MSRLSSFFFLNSFRYLVLPGFLLGRAIGEETKPPPPSAPTFHVSEKRIKIVQREADAFTVEKGFEGHSDAEIYDYLTTAIDNAKIDCKLRPSGDLITKEICKQVVMEKAEKDVKKSFPSLPEDKLAAEAAAAYPMLQKGDKVIISFMPNPARRLRVEGKFEKFDGKNFVIDFKRYPQESVRFIEPQCTDVMLLVDEELNGKKQKEFIDNKKYEQNYQKSQLRDNKRRLYMRQEIAKAIRTNEANGYVFYNHNWYSLKDVVTSEIAKRKAVWLAEKERQEAAARKKAEEEAARLKAEEEQKRLEAGEEAPVFDPQMPENGGPSTVGDDAPLGDFKDFDPAMPPADIRKQAQEKPEEPKGNIFKPVLIEE